MFISFDGIDGVGKTTQIDLLCPWLRECGDQVIQCRDPGSTALGEKLREIVLHRAEIPLHCRSELLIYMAARAQLVEEVIRPALERNEVVVCDRFLLANVVYQAHAGEVDVRHAWQVGQFAVGGIMPDVTLLLDMEPQLAARRLDRTLDRMESRGLEYLTRVRNGFLAEVAQAPDRIRVVAADRPVDEIQSEIRSVIEQYRF